MLRSLRQQLCSHVDRHGWRHGSSSRRLRPRSPGTIACGPQCCFSWLSLSVRSGTEMLAKCPTCKPGKEGI